MAEIATNVQIALFLGQSTGDLADDVWKACLIGRPAGYQEQAPGNTVANGKISGLQFTLQVQSGPLANRIDLIIGGDPNAGVALALPPPIDASAAILAARPYVEKLTNRYKTVRLAIVLNLLDQAANESDALAKVRAQAALPMLPSSAAEVFYQLTSKRDMPPIPVRLVGIHRWQSAKLQIANMLAGALFSPASTKTSDVVNRYIDVSTEDGVGYDEKWHRNIFDEAAAWVERLRVGGLSAL